MRAFMLCLVLALPFISFAQTATPSQTPNSGTQVVYVVDGATLTTYNVDHNLNANQVGTLTLQESTYPNIVPSPTDHFIYYTAYNDTFKTQHLWVYTTDSTGSPQSPAVQEVNVTGLYVSLSINPKADFFYDVLITPDGQSYNWFTVRRYLIDPRTGKISQPKVVARYKLPSGAEGSEGCGFIIDGFNATATKMYDEVDCSAHDANGATYYERSVDLRTGALGRDVEVYSWSNQNGAEYVQFIKNLMFDFVIPNDWQQGVNSIDVYPLKPNTKTPIIDCTAAMLEACGYADTVVFHPSAKYVFTQLSDNTMHVDQVDLKAKKIVDTGNYIPTVTWRVVFSPDGTVVYDPVSSGSGYNLDIFGFDIATSKLTQGGSIYVPNALDSFFVAQRE